VRDLHTGDGRSADPDAATGPHSAGRDAFEGRGAAHAVPGVCGYPDGDLVLVEGEDEAVVAPRRQVPHAAVRSPSLAKQIANLPPSAYATVTVDRSGKHVKPRVHESTRMSSVGLASGSSGPRAREIRLLRLSDHRISGREIPDLAPPVARSVSSLGENATDSSLPMPLSIDRPRYSSSGRASSDTGQSGFDVRAQDAADRNEVDDE
jgi:hypothetical protein